MVPAYFEAVESPETEDDEYGECDDFLYDLELDEGKRAAIALESDAIGGHLKTIFKKRYAP